MYRYFVLIAALLTFSVPCAGSPHAPTGWFLAGSRPQDYSVGTDRQDLAAGRASAYLESNVTYAEGFGTLMQEVSADAYRGQRLRLTVHVKANDVQGWAGVWMRVDGPGLMIVLDNMRDRPIVGNTDWRAYSLVLDVPADASGFAYGLLLEGSGRVWMDAISLEVVDAGVPVTAEPIYVPATSGAKYKATTAPVNLDFES